jgi:cyclopropane fatty-acyl-phospholipid synthase-like methyltransferase
VDTTHAGARGAGSGSAVGELYDQVGDLVALVMGGSLHYGYWRGPQDESSMHSASERMTDLMIRQLGALGPGARVLDVGCGNGVPALRLAESTGVSVLGVNIAPRQVASATRSAQEAGLSDRTAFAIADAGRLGLPPESFDGAWLFESLLHMPDERAVLRGIASALRPGARLVISNLVLLDQPSPERAAALAPLWRAFQIASILSLADYPALLAECGFQTDEVMDITENSVRRTMRTILDAQAGLRERMSSRLDGLESSHDRFAGFAEGESTDLALVRRLAEASEIGYAVLTATRKP